MKKILPRILFIFFAVFMIASGNMVFVLGQSADTPNLTLEVRISPNNIEYTNGSHNVGHVALTNSYGNLIKPAKDVTVRLESSDPTVASVPSEIIIPADSEYAVFGIQTSNKVGSAKIFASWSCC